MNLTKFITQGTIIANTATELVGQVQNLVTLAVDTVFDSPQEPSLDNVINSIEDLDNLPVNTTLRVGQNLTVIKSHPDSYMLHYNGNNTGNSYGPEKLLAMYGPELTVL